MNLIRIDDPADPRVASFLDIRERDLVGRRDRFVAEGKIVLGVLLKSERFSPESVLVLENRLAGLEETLRDAAPDLPVYVVSSAVMDRIAGFHMHRGILAIGHKSELPGVDALLDSLPENALVIVPVGIANHDNMGAIFRNAAAFGADAVFLDRTCCDPLYRKAIRVSVGAALRVPFSVFDDVANFIARLDARGYMQFALSPAGIVNIRDVSRHGRTALYLGTEGEGLPADIMSRMQTLRIDMSAGFDSLNVAAASAIALHRFADFQR